MENNYRNKHGLASALISGVLIISFFMPLIDISFISISAFKAFSEIAKSKSDEAWMGHVFYVYLGLVIINILVQLGKGNKGLSSFVGITGLALLFGFIFKFNSGKKDLGDFGEFLDFTDFIGVGFYVMVISMFALIIVPGFFKNREDDEFEELIKEAETLAEYKPKTTQDKEPMAKTSEIDELKARIAQLEKEKLENEISRLKAQVEELKKEPRNTSGQEDL